MGIPSRMQDRRLVLSKLKQANYATLVSDANLILGKGIPVNAPLFAHPQTTHRDNLAQSMKLHDFPTADGHLITERNIQDELSCDGDTWLLGWFFALAMGKVTSVQPNAAGNPTAWRHTNKPQDPATDGKDLPVTTIYREWADLAAAKGRIHSCHVASVKLAFPPSGVVQVSGSIVGSGQETTGALATPPALLTQQLLQSNDMQFLRGTQGAPTDITSRLVRGSLSFDFTWQFDQENARVPGGGLYMSRAWVGVPVLTMSWQEFVDDTDVTVHTNYLTPPATREEVKVIVNGATIGAGPEKQSLELRVLAAYPQIGGKSQAGDKTIYPFSVGRAEAFKEGANDVCTVIVQNTETSYLV